ncbi:MAG: hypothetical protein JXA39_00390, partial [Bacteroidales bacterium]|nr:hypothetical protein [Bacteroidales bacterium]
MNLFVLLLPLQKKYARKVRHGYQITSGLSLKAIHPFFRPFVISHNRGHPPRSGEHSAKIIFTIYALSFKP